MRDPDDDDEYSEFTIASIIGGTISTIGAIAFAFVGFVLGTFRASVGLGAIMGAIVGSYLGFFIGGGNESDATSFAFVGFIVGALVGALIGAIINVIGKAIR